MKKNIWIFLITLVISFQVPVWGMDYFLSGLKFISPNTIKDVYESIFTGHKCPGPWSKPTVENYRHENNFKAIGEYFYHYMDNKTFDWECFDTIEEFAEKGYPIGMYHYIRNIGSRQGTSEQMRQCLKYVLISYILSTVDYEVCKKVFVFNDGIKGAKALDILMNKYFLFLSIHKTIEKLDKKKTNFFEPLTILNEFVIPWFKKFFPKLKIDDMDLNKDEHKKDFKVVIENNDDHLLDENFDELPPVCWVRVIEKDLGTTGFGNTVLFGVIDRQNSDFCNQQKTPIMELRLQFIKNCIATLKEKTRWQHIFEHQIVLEK